MSGRIVIPACADAALDPRWTFEPLDPRLPNVDIAVTDVFVAQHVAKNADIVISIWNTDPPGAARNLAFPPTWLASHAGAIIYEFDDVTHDHDGYLAPRLIDVHGILTHPWLQPTSPTRILIHCAAGISRSSAVAYVLLGKWSNHVEALRLLRIVRERTERRGWRDEVGFSPNLAIVQHADTLLRTGGFLEEALNDCRTV